MKILVAPNALKGSLSAAQAAAAITRGIREVVPQADILALPVADGGDGMIETLRAVLVADCIACTVHGPLGAPVTVHYLYEASARHAIIEMASAVGLALLPLQARNPLHTSSAGIGELIIDALDRGARRITLGIGGSATHDVGSGMLQALGVSLRDVEGTALAGCGGSLAKIHRIDSAALDARLATTTLQVLCDVDNPLLGTNGAACTFSPQKGADPAMVALLEASSRQFADVLERDLAVIVRDTPGAGAAGGVGAALLALHAVLLPGAETMLNLLNFDSALQGAVLVITAEGRLDAQTRHGKAPAAVAHRARAKNIPCVMLAGSIAAEVDIYNNGFSAAYSLRTDAHTAATAMQHADELLGRKAAVAMADFMAARCQR